jgi:hypothetical protein
LQSFHKKITKNRSKNVLFLQCQKANFKKDIDWIKPFSFVWLRAFEDNHDQKPNQTRTHMSRRNGVHSGVLVNGNKAAAGAQPK